MNVLATVEKVSNGFVVDVAGTRFVATDCIDLAQVFSDVFEVPEVRVDLTDAGRAALAREACIPEFAAIGADLRTGEELLIEHLLKKSTEVTQLRDAGSAPGEKQPEPDNADGGWGNGSPTPPPSSPEPEPHGDPSSGTDEVTRAPIADDGFEFPPVKQLGANHFVVVCPAHGDQRMERRGAAWVCPRKDKNAECTTRIPREAMQRALRAA